MSLREKGYSGAHGNNGAKVALAISVAVSQNAEKVT
jgi:hypothetical protein